MRFISKVSLAKQQVDAASNHLHNSCSPRSLTAAVKALALERAAATVRQANFIFGLMVCFKRNVDCIKYHTMPDSWYAKVSVVNGLSW